jgi:hypothetical protein
MGPAGDPSTDTLGNMSCTDGDTVVYDATLGAWSCILLPDEATVDGWVTDNGYASTTVTDALDARVDALEATDPVAAAIVAAASSSAAEFSYTAPAAGTTTANKVSRRVTLTRGLYEAHAYQCNITWSPVYYMTEGIVTVVSGTLRGQYAGNVYGGSFTTTQLYERALGTFTVTSATAVVDLGWMHNAGGTVTVSGGGCDGVYVTKLL